MRKNEAQVYSMNQNQNYMSGDNNFAKIASSNNLINAKIELKVKFIF